MQFQQNCLTDGKNQEAFQYFKETAAAISLVAENGINILSMQYDKIQQVSEDTVLASYLAPQNDVKMPQMPEAVIYPFGLNQSQKLAVERALSSKISIIQGPPGTGRHKRSEYHRQCCSQRKNRGGCLQQQFRNA